MSCRPQAWTLAAAATVAAATQFTQSPLFKWKGVDPWTTFEAKTHIANLTPLEHYWPHARGRLGQYSQTDYNGPANLNESQPAWTWHHPAGRYHTIVIGAPLIDHQKNLYLTSEDGIRKLDPDGNLLWYYQGASDMVTCPSLCGATLFGNTHDGHVFAVNIATGKEFWSIYPKPWNGVGSDVATFNCNDDGVLLMATDILMPGGGGNKRVLGFDAMKGSQMWEYALELPLMNFLPVFPDKDTFVIMDATGGVHRLDVHSGKPLWHEDVPDGSKRSFSVGGVSAGPNGDLYTCSNYLDSIGMVGQPGVVRRYSLETGQKQWELPTDYPCNSWPVVSHDGRSVIVPTGAFASGPLSESGKGLTKDAQFKMHEDAVLAGERGRSIMGLADLPGAILVIDAEKGQLQQDHQVKPYGGIAAAGDEEGYLERGQNHTRKTCGPPHWSAPTISKDGTVFVGRVDGRLYAYHPERGVSSTYYTGTAPTHPGVSFAPGMMAYADCDSLYVFKVPES
mmetsp:Transcript_35673/g.113370  ORF Transcript_35673/g.113370 Transcript_35673/m.113370 type:complete len:507 (-) Transcript_35673:96-1616(-)